MRKVQISALIVAILAAFTQLAPEIVPVVPEKSGAIILLITNVISAFLPSLRKVK